jgi:hypothetical protein
MSRHILGPRTEKVTAMWRKLHNIKRLTRYRVYLKKYLQIGDLRLIHHKFHVRMRDLSLYSVSRTTVIMPLGTSIVELFYVLGHNACSPFKVNRRFGGAWRLHLQSQRTNQWITQRDADNKKRRLTSNGLHCVISQKTELLITTAVITSNISTVI